LPPGISFFCHQIFLPIRRAGIFISGFLSLAPGFSPVFGGHTVASRFNGFPSPLKAAKAADDFGIPESPG
jgi:hypothetical protein